MKGLWKYISPFAPDDSGAAAVLYGLNGIVVICDAEAVPAISAGLTNRAGSVAKKCRLQRRPA